MANNGTNDSSKTDLVISRLDSAWIKLREAKTIQDTKRVLDAAAAAGIYAKRQKMSDEIIGAAHSIRIFALLQLGQQLKKEPKAKGGVPYRNSTCTPLVQVETLENKGIDRKLASLSQSLTKLPKEKIEAIADRQLTISQAKREIKEAERKKKRSDNSEKVKSAKSISELSGKFSTIVIDPPWDWGDEGDNEQLGRGSPVFSTIPFPELLQFPIQDCADDDCHIYLWITNRSLPKGFSLLESWGFRYVTCLTWCKPHFGMGNYFRGQTEHVLFGVRGHQLLKRKDAGTVFHAPRPKGNLHSAKPNEFYSLVESCSFGPYLDVFSRLPRDGWTVWGAEV